MGTWRTTTNSQLLPPSDMRYILKQVTSSVWSDSVLSSRYRSFISSRHIPTMMRQTAAHRTGSPEPRASSSICMAFSFPLCEPGCRLALCHWGSCQQPVHVLPSLLMLHAVLACLKWAVKVIRLGLAQGWQRGHVGSRDAGGFQSHTSCIHCVHSGTVIIYVVGMKL